MRLLAALAGLAILSGGAALAAADADEPRARAAAGDALQLSGTVIDKTDLILDDKWTINESFSVYDTDGWRGEYAYQIPSSIPPEGAQVSLAVKATDKTGGRFSARMGLGQHSFFIEGEPTEIGALADKNGGMETATATTSFKIVPGSYCDTCTPSITIGIQDGPRITYQYRVVPTVKACPGGRIAQNNGAFIIDCLTTYGAPGRGKVKPLPAQQPPKKAHELSAEISFVDNLGNPVAEPSLAAVQAKAEKATTLCFMLIFGADPVSIERGQQYIPAAFSSCVETTSRILARYDEIRRKRRPPPSPGAVRRGCASGVARKSKGKRRPAKPKLRVTCARTATGVKVTIRPRSSKKTLRAALGGRALKLYVGRSALDPAGTVRTNVLWTAR